MHVKNMMSSSEEGEWVDYDYPSSSEEEEDDDEEDDVPPPVNVELSSLGLFSRFAAAILDNSGDESPSIRLAVPIIPGRRSPFGVTITRTPWAKTKKDVEIKNLRAQNIALLDNISKLISTNKIKFKEEDLCGCCCILPADAVGDTCGHKYACIPCSLRLRECPLCRMVTSFSITI